MNQEQDQGRYIGAAILIGLGVIFLLQQIFDFSFIGQLWPFFIILPGLGFLTAAWIGDEKAAQMVYPGAIVTGTGLILLVQNMTGRFESWSYAWALYPVFVGFAAISVGQRKNNEKMVTDGKNTLRTGVILFVVFAIFFEGFIFGGFSGLRQYVLPIVFIGLGLALLFRDRVPFLAESKPKNKNGSVEDEY